MTFELPATFKKLVDAGAVVTVGTVNPNGSPQTSILWATYDGDDILLSTIEGRQKHKNWQRDPRASVIVFDPAEVWTYVEVRGAVTMTRDGGPELIERLSQIYAGVPFTNDEGTGNVRLVVRLSPEKVVTH